MLRFLCIASFGFLALLGPLARAQALRCEPAVIDFGRKPENQAFTLEAQVTNTLSTPVKIISVQGDCSCITVDTPIMDLAPGQSTTLTIHQQSGGLEGDFQHSITLATSAGGNTILPVRISVFSHVNWTVQPSRLILPSSSPGREVGADLRVTHVGAVQLGVDSITVDSPYLAITAGPVEGDTITYHVTKRAEAPAGPIYSDIKIRTTDSSAEVLDVPVFAYVTP